MYWILLYTVQIWKEFWNKICWLPVHTLVYGPAYGLVDVLSCLTLSLWLKFSLFEWAYNNALINQELGQYWKCLSCRPCCMDLTAFGPYAMNVRRNFMLLLSDGSVHTRKYLFWRSWRTRSVHEPWTAGQIFPVWTEISVDFNFIVYPCK